MQIKPLQDTITHLLEWIKVKRINLPGVGENEEQQESQKHCQCSALVD